MGEGLRNMHEEGDEGPRNTHDEPWYSCYLILFVLGTNGRMQPVVIGLNGPLYVVVGMLYGG